ncbi:MAG TPA: hypothetical protein VJ302_33890 [Blastocatellia bacterium]|nr:hypothetical protein [Blastocatellia bacterium]
MQFEFYRIEKLALSILTLLLAFSPQILAQRAKSQTGASRRITFAEARRLLSGESEGNLAKTGNTFTRTKLTTGQVLEVYYPITAPAAAGRSGKPRSVTVAGYGVLYQSEASYNDASRPRHMLEDLIPDGKTLVTDVPQLVARLERRLGVGAGRLDYSRTSLRRLDGFIAGFHRSHTTAQTDPRLFQELTAYYGETLRRAINGEWQTREERLDESHVQVVPNISYSSGGKTKDLKPWSSVIGALYDEDNRGVGLTKLFDADLAKTR